jgi:transposase
MISRGPYRRHSARFKLQLCQDIRNGVIGRRDAQRTYKVSANLIQHWLTQFDRGELTEEEVGAGVIAEYEAPCTSQSDHSRVAMPIRAQEVAALAVME